MEINRYFVEKTIMDIQAEKLSLIERLARVQDVHMIQQVKEILEQSKEKAVGMNPDGSIITQADLIDRAKASNRAIREGRTKSIDQVRKDMKKW